MLRVFHSLLASAVAVLLTSPASAAILVFSSPLVPEAPGATGGGNTVVTWDSDLNTLRVEANWSGLSGTTTVAHIHCCVPSPGSGTVGVAVTPNTFPGFPTMTTSGSYLSGPLDLNAATTYTTGPTGFTTVFGGGTVAGSKAALLNGLNNGRAYLNIHTTTFPGGEIRGFLRPVPEPATWALMLVGFAAISSAMRRRRKVQQQVQFTF